MLNVAEVKRLALESNVYDFDVDVQAVQQAIKSVTASIEGYLERPVIAATFREYVDDWEYSRIGDHYRISPTVTPVLDVATEHIRFNDKNIIFSTQPEYFEYTAGYENEVPDDIKRVAFRLVMYEMGFAQGDLYTLDSKTVVTGSTTATVNKTRDEVYRDELAKLHTYKKWLINSRYVEPVSE
jgi:hypothetical protein